MGSREPIPRESYNGFQGTYPRRILQWVPGNLSPENPTMGSREPTSGESNNGFQGTYPRKIPQWVPGNLSPGSTAGETYLYPLPRIKTGGAKPPLPVCHHEVPLLGHYAEDTVSSPTNGGMSASSVLFPSGHTLTPVAGRGDNCRTM
jgi:hypothetical protein